MGSKKEEERNEKIIRGLMKLPPNRRCINCNSMGPQYVCTNFWSFVCIACSGIHREFTHRVKSVSMAKFTSQEVEALQNGGNQRAREIYLKNWDLQRQRLPESSNVEKIRQFIKDVYVDKNFAAGQTSEKPPRDSQNRGICEDDTRRASSYHSFSQSPPYDYQYEDRKYGKQAGSLTRKPGSDRGRYEGKASSFVYSPGRGSERIFGDGFSAEGSISRVSDYSASSAGDPFRSGTQSPNYQKDRESFGSPPFAISRANSIATDSFSQRSRSLGSFGSIDGNFASFDSGPKQASETASSVAPIDLFQLPEAPLPASSMNAFEPAKAFTPLDLFAASNENLPSAPSNEGWATFDTPQSTAPTFRNDNISPAILPSSDSRPLEDLDLFSSAHDTTMQCPSAPQDFSFHSDLPTTNPTDTQLWNAFADSLGQQTFDGFKQDSGVLAGSDTASSTSNQNSSLGPLEESHFQSSDHGHFDWGVALDPPPYPLGEIEATCSDRKSNNPFDLPYDSQLEENDVFMDMTSLHNVLPNDHLSSSFVGDVSQPWFPENTVIQQAPSPQIPNVAAQGSLAAGNPFA